ncbi:MAG: PqqD family protein [Acidimicrobiia bacterium]|nr:PqqD family protein [Acidimicrobiia bacterium]
MNDAAQRLRANTPTIAAEEIDGEVVIVNFDTGHYFSLRSTAAEIWRLLEAGFLSTEVAELYANGEPESVRRFVGSLLDANLMVAESPNGHPSRPEVEVGEFSEPVLERFEEMSDMLLYDPIHDVDDTGWPNLPGDAGKAT